MNKILVLVICLAPLTTGQECSASIVDDDVVDIHALTGETIQIPCRIKELNNGTVIWQFSKKKIPEYLTVGLFNYRRDRRVRVVSTTLDTDNSTESWDLVIEKLQLSDQGFYFCRVVCGSYTVKRMVKLHVDFKLDLGIATTATRPEDGGDITLLCNSTLSVAEVTRKQVIRAGFYKPSLKLDMDSLKFDWIRRDPFNQSSHVIDSFIINKITLKDMLTGGNNRYHLNRSYPDIAFRNYHVEYFFTPFIHSRLHIYGVGLESSGYFKCQLQNHTAYVAVHSAERLRVSTFSSTWLLSPPSLGQLLAASILEIGRAHV